MRKVGIVVGLALFALTSSAEAKSGRKRSSPQPARKAVPAEEVGPVPAAEAPLPPAAEPAPAPATEAAPTPATEAAPGAAADSEASPATTPAEVHRLVLGVDGAFQLPLGSFADVTGMGFGGLLRVEFNVISSLNVTLRGGYVYPLKKNVKTYRSDGAVETEKNFTTKCIPIWVGAKYFFLRLPTSISIGIYGAAEFGYNRLSSSWDGTLYGQPASAPPTPASNKFGGTFGAGALFGPVDIKAQLVLLDFSNAGDSMAFMMNVGVNFLELF